MYIDKLDEIVNKSNNTYHRTIRIKSIGFSSNMYIDFDVENENELHKDKSQFWKTFQSWKSNKVKGWQIMCQEERLW